MSGQCRGFSIREGVGHPIRPETVDEDPIQSYRLAEQYSIICRAKGKTSSAWRCPQIGWAASSVTGNSHRWPVSR